MLVLRYTTGTLLARQNRQPDMRGSGHMATKPTTLYTQLQPPGYTSLAILDIEALKVFTVIEDFRHTVLSTF